MLYKCVVLASRNSIYLTFDGPLVVYGLWTDFGGNFLLGCRLQQEMQRYLSLRQMNQVCKCWNL